MATVSKKVVLHLRDTIVGNYFMKEFVIKNASNNMEAEHIAKMKARKKGSIEVVATCCVINNWKKVV